MRCRRDGPESGSSSSSSGGGGGGGSSSISSCSCSCSRSCGCNRSSSNRALYKANLVGMERNGETPFPLES